MNDRKIEVGIIKAMLIWKKSPHRVARRLRQSEVNIFLPSIFLSFEWFCINFFGCGSSALGVTCEFFGSMTNSKTCHPYGVLIA
jgi:hypothetical protein